MDTVARESHCGNSEALRLPAADQVPACGVPEFESLVIAAREEARSVGRERHRSDGFRAPFEGTQQSTGRCIPKLDNLVLAAREQARAVRRDSC